jgi:Family of unknown function (DUF6220)
MRILRYIYAAASALFVLAVAVQVFLAGMFLFADGSREAHVEWGYTISLMPVVLIVLAAAARPGWRLFGMTAALLLVTWLQSILAALKTIAPVVAALHPVNAMLIFGLGVLVTRRAIGLARTPEADSASAAERVHPAAAPGPASTTTRG